MDREVPESTCPTHRVMLRSYWGVVLQAVVRERWLQVTQSTVWLSIVKFRDCETKRGMIVYTSAGEA